MMMIPGTDYAFWNNHKQPVTEENYRVVNWKINDKIHNRETEYNGNRPPIFLIFKHNYLLFYKVSTIQSSFGNANDGQLINNSVVKSEHNTRPKAKLPDLSRNDFTIQADMFKLYRTCLAFRFYVIIL